MSLPPRTKTRLRRLAAKYETAAFVDGDPIRFLRTASGPGVETMAFVAATRAGATSPSTGSASTRSSQRNDSNVTVASPDPSASARPSVETSRPTRV